MSKQSDTATKPLRCPLCCPGACIWLTGLPCSGKTTLASALARYIQTQRPVELFDGERVRKTLNSDLGFSPEDRKKNLHRVAYVVQKLKRHGVLSICSFVSPSTEVRREVRQMIGEPFIEVFVSCPVDVCKKRDLKGMYKRAEVGELPLFTGVSAPYEAPTCSEVVVDTSVVSTQQAMQEVLCHLTERGLL